MKKLLVLIIALLPALAFAGDMAEYSLGYLDNLGGAPAFYSEYRQYEPSLKKDVRACLVIGFGRKDGIMALKAGKRFVSVSDVTYSPRDGRLTVKQAGTGDFDYARESGWLDGFAGRNFKLLSPDEIRAKLRL